MHVDETVLLQAAIDVRLNQRAPFYTRVSSNYRLWRFPAVFSTREQRITPSSRIVPGLPLSLSISDLVTRRVLCSVSHTLF